MLNKKTRVNAMKDLEKAIEKHEDEQKRLISYSELLHEQRVSLQEILEMTFAFLNEMRNKPEEMKIEVEKLKIEFTKYEKFVADINEEVEKTFKYTAGGVGSGLAAGAGIASFGPSVAMAIATTFGTASTGAAISSLSGAAATKAALAWLGGGAIAAGGSGIAGGSALVALSGPIGWTIGGASLLGAGLLRNSKNKKVAMEANEKEVEIIKQTKLINGTSLEIYETKELTKETVKRLRPYSQSIQLKASKYKFDYKLIKESGEKDLIFDLGSLVNQSSAALRLLNRPIGGARD